MSKEIIIKKILIVLLFLNLSIDVFSQEARKIGFYKLQSSSEETSTNKMTQDLFYTKLVAINSITPVDKREIDFSPTLPNLEPEIIYVEIIQKETNQWICRVHHHNIQKNTHTSEEILVDSYYKLLLDSKKLLEEVIFSNEKITITEEQQVPTQNLTINIEQLAGTWKGEAEIDKIMILRGGRGFIFFKNGATMNISLTTENNELIIKQTSNPNASFFPNLPREIALKTATSAKPLIWKFFQKGDAILEGKKFTVSASIDNDNTISLNEIILPVIWTRQ